MPSPSASAIATRFAAHWIADALAGDKSLEFSVLKALVGSSSEAFAGAPEATRERVALRCLQEVSSVIAAGGEAAATARVLRVDGGARSCEDVLFRLIREVGSSGKLKKDLLPPFSQDIQETIFPILLHQLEDAENSVGRKKKQLFLREAMAKFTPQNDAPFLWIQILEYGSDVFHMTRRPSDLRVKWRNTKKWTSY